MDSKEIEGLTFEKDTHTYRLNGVEIPSVSAVMAPLNNEKYKGIDSRTLNVAADRGTAIHTALEDYMSFGIMDIPAEFQGYADAFMDWHRVMNPKPILLEHKTCHKLLRYAGTIDNVSEINGVTTLIDYKTTSSINSKTFGVQLEAYAKCLEEEGIKVGRKIILHLTKAGKWQEIEFPVNDTKCWRIFGYLKSIYDYINS